MSAIEIATEKPLVLIVGAGLGGLTLGALLEKADIPYQILERIETIKPYGSTMCISAPLLPLFHQLGIADEFIAVAKLSPRVHIHQEDSLKPAFVSDFSVFCDLTGYESYTASRPVVHNLLLNQIPANKIHFGKRILTIKEEDSKMIVRAADGTTFRGDIVVGADGTYSAVRQRLYELLASQDRLPKEDLEDLPFSCTCLVGQTNPLDPEDFLILKESDCHFSTILVKDKPYTIALLTTAQSTICWLVLHHLDSESIKTAEKQRFRSCDNSEWGPYQALAMCGETRAFSIPMGDKFKTLGDIYDNTPSDLITKVMLEEKVFETWYSGRTHATKSTPLALKAQ
ncbi:hypothetical protein BGZ96_003016 [Linnemannia gamsii]|uniref:FAD-binding domain-containing protein n=1 Tax=Linnemannia gamsii TaxID=64522 RepID=A0ABQ7K8R5_9FUNG|nr:hypothetical protein BGZ96_003016 [Linnemannia gamsii]